MAGAGRERRLSAPQPGLIAIDGVNGAAVNAVARATLGSMNRRFRGGISWWDASGVFEELAVAGEEAGAPSPRTLLLLYAADLAFRVRWEIRPALAAGRTVVAVPYIDTAIAFGRSAGLPNKWLLDLFGFAPAPTQAHYVHAAPPRSAADRKGFIEFGCEQLKARPPQGLTRPQLIDRARNHLQAAARRGRRHADRDY